MFPKVHLITINLAAPDFMNTELFQVIKLRHRYETNTVNLPSHPTFTEFVRFIINEDLDERTMDMHWEPVYKFCTPCQFPITHIVKMETFNQDQVIQLSP
jgi:hypothetical protein